jgi:ribonucleotide monophosphatase NagD (HAD superfamily)
MKHVFDFKEIIIVGDKINEEIKAGNELGITTVRMKYGRHSGVEPRNDSEKPVYCVKNLLEFLDILKSLNSRK